MISVFAFLLLEMDLSELSNIALFPIKDHELWLMSICYKIIDSKPNLL